MCGRFLDKYLITVRDRATGRTLGDFEPYELGLTQGGCTVKVFRDGDKAVAYSWKGEKIIEGTDHTEVIQEAIKDLPEGGKIYIDSGIYYVYKTIEINAPITIEGAGPYATRIIGDLDGDIFAVGTDTSSPYGNNRCNVFMNIGLWGKPQDIVPLADTDYSKGSAIHIMRASNPLIFNVVVGRKEYGIRLDRQDGLYNTSIIKVRTFYNLYGIGLNIARMVHIEDVWGYLDQYSLITGSIGYGLFMRDVTAEACGWNNPDNTGSVVGISVEGAGDIRIEDLYINGSKGGGLSPAKQLLQIILNDGSYCCIRGMILQSGKHYGANIWGGSGDYPIYVKIQDFIIGPLGSAGYMGDPGTVDDWGLRIAVGGGHIELVNGYINARYGILWSSYETRRVENVIENGKRYKRRDVAVFSGDGTTTQFKVEHGLVAKPSTVTATPLSADAKDFSYAEADDTYIYFNFSTAPPSGTDNIKICWEAET